VTVAAVTAPVPALEIGVPEDERLVGLTWIDPRAPRPVASVGMDLTVLFAWVVPVVGVVVELPFPVLGVVGSVSVDVAATGVGVAVGVTGGVPENGLFDSEKAPVVADEFALGRAAGTTVPVPVDVQPRPWHTFEFELEVEFPVTAGRPLTPLVAVPGWAEPSSP
jgi:hypothetical protein